MLTTLLLVALSQTPPRAAIQPGPQPAIGQPYGAPVIRIPFQTPGCYASGSAMGMRGEAVTVARNSTATYVDANGAIQTCQANQLRVGPQGAIIEPQRDNLVTYSNDASQWTASASGTGSAPQVTQNYSSAPDGTQTAARVQFSRGAGNTTSDFSRLATNTVTWAGAGYWGLYVRSTDGVSTPTLALEVSGTGKGAFTVTGTWQRIATSVTLTGGYIPRVELIGGTGGTGATADVLIWGGQAEVGTYPTSLIPTTTTSARRYADAVSVATPANLGPRYCVAATYQPVGGAAWTAANRLLYSTGTSGAASTFRDYFGTDGALHTTTRDAANASLSWATGNLSYAAGSSHRIVTCRSSGLVNGYGDGVALSGSTSGTGTGIIATHATPLYLGTDSAGGTELGGAISDLRVCRGRYGGLCK